MLVDGNQFRGCVFKNCQLLITGAAPFSLVECTLDGVGLHFDGPAATTLTILKVLRQTDFREVIDEIIAGIVRGDQLMQNDADGVRS